MEVSINSRIGETIRANNGQLMTIIAYRKWDDIDVKFEDGNIIEHREYSKFKKGQIKNTKFRLGETSISTKGQKMKIIAYRNCNDMDVKFEDGTIVKNTFYQQFKDGQITNPNYTNSIAKIGEEIKTQYGQKMKIIAYRDCNDIDIQFEDGTIVEHRIYREFKKGRIRNPNFFSASRIGEKKVNKQGLQMEIIKYSSYNDIAVKFEDGTIVSNKTYFGFKEGTIEHPNVGLLTRKNSEKLSKCGLKMKVIEYRMADDIDIQFEDGFIVSNRRYAEFEKGKILHPNFLKNSNISASNNYFGYKVKFAFDLNNKKYYHAINIKTGFEFIATLQELYKGSTINE